MRVRQPSNVLMISPVLTVLTDSLVRVREANDVLEDVSGLVWQAPPVQEVGVHLLERIILAAVGRIQHSVAENKIINVNVNHT